MQNITRKFFTAALLIGALSQLAGCGNDDDDASPDAPATSEKTVTMDCTKANIATDVIWADVAPGNAIDYLVKCPVRVKGSAVLTIAPGVIVQFEGAASGIFTEDNAGLTAVGTAAAPIRLVGKNAAKGAWMGVWFGSNNPANQLAYVTVEHAGSQKDTWVDEKAAVAISRLSPSARASITNCTIRQSDGYGLWVAPSRNLAAFSTNDINNCALAPVALSFDRLDRLDAASKYKEGNGQAYIDVYQSSVEDGSGDLLTDLTVKALEVPYRVKVPTQTKAALTIQAGAVLEFVAGAGLSTYELGQGTINATGAADKRIVFRGVQAGAGTWVGIAVASSSSANQFRFCDISGGGSQPPFGGNVGKGNLVLGYYGEPIRATVQDCNISNSGGWGIWRSSASTLTQASNTFASNVSGNVGP